MCMAARINTGDARHIGITGGAGLNNAREEKRNKWPTGLAEHALGGRRARHRVSYIGQRRARVVEIKAELCI